MRYRGADINDILDLPYDAVSYLLIRGKLPYQKELAAYSAILRGQQNVGVDVLNVLRVCNFNL